MEQEEYTYEPHQFYKPKRLPWMICRCCGLVTLSNPLTEWSIKKGCNYKDAPNFQQVVLKHTKLF